MTVRVCLLFLYAFLGMAFDLRTGKIPNALIAAGLAGGAVCQLVLLGPMGILSFMAGLAVPFGAAYILFLFRMVGAGDIKLLMALGCVAGFPLIARIMLWSVISGGAIALYLMWRRTGFRSRFAYLAGYISDFIRTGERKPYRREGCQPENFHFTVAICAAVILCVLTGC